MKKYILILAVLPLLLQCKNESPFDDLGGSATLKGVMIMYDTLNGTVIPTTGKNAKIYLKHPGSTSFLYTVSSNALGQYIFNGINLNKDYIIYSSTDTGTVKYYGKLDYNHTGFSDGQSDTLKLFPAIDNQNILHLIVRDIQGAPVPNVTAWVFNSAVLFNADTSAGRVFDMTVNGYGVNNRYNIAPGIYYLRIKTRIGNLDLAGETMVNMDPVGIKNAIITLQNIPLSRNGIEVHVTDIFNTPVSNATVYFYRSQAIYLADTIHYNNSLFFTNTNASGLAAAYILEPATYYVRAIKPINADTLTDKKAVNVTLNAISQLDLKVQ